MKRQLSYIFFFVFLSTAVYSKHIVGGEIIYDNLGGNNYRITLKIYRDCSSDGPNFDGLQPGTTALITIIEGLSSAVDTVLNIGLPVVTQVVPSINNPCIQPPNGVCVEEGIYTCTLNLPAKTGGYYIVYQSCCRNVTIVNLASGGGQGATYYAQIPGPELAPINSSPRFKKFPPIYICNNVPFSFDHSASDPDGDQLVYSLYAPFLGLPGGCSNVGSVGCPTAGLPPPYLPVNYSGSYSGTYPIASSPAFTIHPTTGILTGRPNLVGQYVVGICVKEFRGNVLISQHFRDFQFNVRPCIVNVASVFEDQVKQCEGSIITFTNQSFGNVGALTYHWDFGVNGTLADTSKALHPTYHFQDTGQYIVTLIANPGSPCADTMKKTVYIYPALQVAFNTAKTQCLKQNSFTFTNTGAYINSTTYKWDFTSNATPSISTVKNPAGIVYTQAGKYPIKLVAKQLTCIDSVIDTVRVIGRPLAKINNLPNTYCDPATVAFSNGSVSELPLTYKWIFGEGKTSTAYQPTQLFTPAGVYGATLVILTSGICVDTSMASVQNITVTPTPKADFSFSPTLTTIFDPEITFTNASSADVISLTYNLGDDNFSNVPDFTHTYQAPGNYFVVQIVSNKFSCSDTVIKEVRILPEFRFWIPNTFTPNNDGRNDIFMPSTIGVSEYEFYIYDKWGQRVYSGTDRLQGWDGTFKSQKCEQDLYVWKITFTNDVTHDYEDHYGHVLLLRSDD